MTLISLSACTLLNSNSDDVGFSLVATIPEFLGEDVHIASTKTNTTKTFVPSGTCLNRDDSRVFELREENTMNLLSVIVPN